MNGRIHLKKTVTVFTVYAVTCDPNRLQFRKDAYKFYTSWHCALETGRAIKIFLMLPDLKSLSAFLCSDNVTV